jgi:Zn-dependent peptidase ImmA (M78 family)
MINLNIRQYKRGANLFLSKTRIESIAMRYIRDYKPKALQDPHPISADEFVECYLGYKIRYENLSHNQSILGMTITDGGNIPIYDKESNSVSHIQVEAKTVLIDNHLLDDNQRGRYEFTLMHEAGHIVLHCPNQSTRNKIFVFSELKESESIIRKEVENFCRINKTPMEWQEWQADYFASCMKLPKPMVRKFVMQVLRDMGLKQDCISSDSFTTLLLKRKVAEYFVTSMQAAEICLKELQIIDETKLTMPKS